MNENIPTILGNPDDESQVGKMLPDDKVEEITNKYISQLVKPKKLEKPFLLAPVGLVGSGKSTVVKRISKEFGLLRISTDEIRKILTGKGYNLRRTAEIAYGLIFNYLSKGYGVAIDADCARKNIQESIKKMGSKLDIPIAWVHISTPESVILERLDENNVDREYKGEEAKKVYFNRKQLHSNLDVDFVYVFDGAGDFEKEFDRAKLEINKHVQTYYSSK